MEENSIYHQVFIRPREEAHDLFPGASAREEKRFDTPVVRAECRVQGWNVASSTDGKRASLYAVTH